MPRKTKEQIEETQDIKQSAVKKKTGKSTESKKSSTKKASSTEEKKVATRKTKATDEKKVTAKKAKATDEKKATTKKAKAADEKKVTTKKAKATDEKKATTKKAKTADEKKVTAKKAKTADEKKVATKAKTTEKSSKTTSKRLKTSTPMAVEYYDLPYQYNKTVVKILYQNPTTLFVYWEISADDIENYKLTYGDNFFETTKPVLIVHNDTMNYTFEIDINDFANCWYFNINDSKCNYHVELGRRPIAYNSKIKNDYIYISSSNEIESPNDKILFNTNEDFSVYFRNTKNYVQRKVNLQKIIKQLNLKNKDFDFPLIKDLYELYKNIYQVEDITEFNTISNPSSGNPTSGIL